MYNIIDLFAGIGGIRLGFEAHGCKTVFSSEWDKYARKMYEDNFGDRPFGDINQLEPKDIPDHDILLAGFPCQPFSIAGKGLGFADTRGTLFFNIEEILRIKKPYAFFLENVKRLTTHDNGNTFKVITEKLKGLGYFIHCKVLNSLDYGIPQKRERIYIVGFKEDINFEFPIPVGSFRPLNEFMESDELVDKSYFVTNYIKEKRLKHVKGSPQRPTIWHENIGGNISALPYSCALRAGGSYNYLLVNGERRLTEREMLNLQGFPKNFKITVPYTQARKIAGNSVTVPVIKAIAKNIIRSMNNKEPAVRIEQMELWELQA